MANNSEYPPHDASLNSVAEHVLTDLHEVLRLMTKVDQLLEEFRPMIEAFRGTGGGSIGVLRARKAIRNGHS